MTEVIGVTFKDGGKVYFFDPAGTAVEEKQDVIVDTSRGIEFGTCVQANRMVEDNSIVSPLRPLVRIATDEDRKRLADNKVKEKKAFDICQQKILEHKLDMKLIEVEYNFDGSKILFFFTSDGRVDFRELVKSLATIFKTRIELRQIGVRDEAKLLGGLGICGKPFCCSTFLEDFQPVSIKMAKTQNLSLNPTKISGTCGRLMCCLKYEQDAYESLLKETPKVDTPVLTPDGPGKVTEVSLIRGILKVKLASDGELAAVHSYKNEEISPLDSHGNPIRPVGKKAPAPVTSFEDSMPSVRYNSDKVSPEAPEPEAPKAQEKKRHHNSKPSQHKEHKETKESAEKIPAEQHSQERHAAPNHNKKRRHRRPAKKNGDGQHKESGAVQSHAPKAAPPQQGSPAAKSAEGQAPKKNYHRRHRPRKKPNGEGGNAQN